MGGGELHPPPRSAPDIMKTLEQYTVVQLKQALEIAFIDNSAFQFELSILECSFSALTILLFPRNKLDCK